MRNRRAPGDPGDVRPVAVPPGNRLEKNSPDAARVSSARLESLPPVHVYRHQMVDWFFSTLSEPAPTLRRILDAGPNRWILAAGAVIGTTSILENAWLRRLGDDVNLPLFLLFAFMVGPLLGLALVHGAAVLIRFTGRLLGGGGRHHEVCAAVACGAAPQLLLLPLLLVGAPGGLYSGGPTATVFGWLLLAAGAWSTFIWSTTIAEAQRFSSRPKGLANLLLACAFAGAIFFAGLLMFAFIADSLRPY